MLAGVLTVGSLLLAACSTSHPTVAPAVSGKPVKGGVASYAMPIGEDFSWMLPLENEAN